MTNKVTVVIRESSLDELEKRIEVGLSGGMDAVSAMKEIRDRELWREKYSTFDDYMLSRFGVEASHTKRLLHLKLPDQLEQREIWHQPSEVSPAAVADISVMIERAKKQGSPAVLQLVKEQEERIKKEEAEATARFNDNVREERINGLISRLKWCSKVVGLVGLEPWEDKLKQCLEEVKLLE